VIKNLFQNKEEAVSIHSDHITEIHTMPIKCIIRPFPSELNEDKVQFLMETLQVKDIEWFYYFYHGLV